MSYVITARTLTQPPPQRLYFYIGSREMHRTGWEHGHEGWKLGVRYDVKTDAEEEALTAAEIFSYAPGTVVKVLTEVDAAAEFVELEGYPPPPAYF
jgi:hypothetical protein